MIRQPASSPFGPHSLRCTLSTRLRLESGASNGLSTNKNAPLKSGAFEFGRTRRIRIADLIHVKDAL